MSSPQFASPPMLLSGPPAFEPERDRRIGRPPYKAPFDFGSFEAALSEPCAPSVAMTFLMMARRMNLGVKAYPHRTDPATWCFKFHKSGHVEIDGAGGSRWLAGHPDIRTLVDRLIEHARARQSAPVWAAD